MRLYRLVCLTDDATGVINGFDKYTSFDDACNAGAAWADYWPGHILMVVETNINENPELVEGTKAKFRRTLVNGTPHVAMLVIFGLLIVLPLVALAMINHSYETFDKDCLNQGYELQELGDRVLCVSDSGLMSSRSN